MQHPIIVVPGITASELRDEYPVTPEGVWSALLHKRYDRITLHPDDLRYELIEPARVRSDAVFKLPYRELIDELRHELTQRADRPVPVYPFPYDWRMPLDQTEARLDAFVDEVIDRTKLMKHYGKRYAADPRVDLVGHSMGGLIIAGYLQRKGIEARVGKVATIGTPYRGSFEAPIKVATGTATLGDVESASREREAARLTPALYHLTPRYEGAIETDADLPADLYDVATWQPGVFETVGEFIRLHGVDAPRSKQKREEVARSLLGEMLAIARAHRDRVESFDLAHAGLDPSRWLCIVGVNTVTRVGLRIAQHDGEPRFDLSSDLRLDCWEEFRHVEERVQTGDGTVPYRGAKPAFLGVEHLVCVRPDDFGYWEIGDRMMLGPVGLHGMLPKMNLVHRLIVSHLTGEPRKGTWGRPAPDIGDRAWAPPIEGLEPKDD